MNLRQIEIFCAVVRTRTTVAAAYELALTQPAVSNAIKHLEETLGLSLFDRVGNRLVPTKEALSIYRDAQPLHLMAATVRQKVVELRDVKRGHIRVVSTNPLGDSIIPEAIAKFLIGRPNVQVFFDVDGMTGVIEAVEAGFADFGVAVSPDARPSLCVTPLTLGQMVCIIPHGHPLAEKKSLSPRELANAPLVGLDPITRLGSFLANAFHGQGTLYEPSVVVRKGVTACSLVNRGVGIAVVDEFSAVSVPERKFAIRPFTPSIPINGSTISLRDRSLSRLAKKLISILKSVAEDAAVTSLSRSRRSPPR